MYICNDHLQSIATSISNKEDLSHLGPEDKPQCEIETLSNGDIVFGRVVAEFLQVPTETCPRPSQWEVEFTHLARF